MCHIKYSVFDPPFSWILLMRVGTLVVIGLIILAAIYLYRNREGFIGSNTLSLTWAQSGPNPANIAYNWAVCINGTGPPHVGYCAMQDPAYPPGMPGSGWDYKGQTPAGQNSLTLGNLNCNSCNYGQTLSLFLQAVDVVNPAHPASDWATFTIDLSSKATVVKATITDSNTPSEPVYPGSSGFIYTLQLNQPAFAQGNIAIAYAQVIRGSQYLSMASVPFSSISSDNTTGTLNGSFTSGSWSPSAPGTLQLGDILTVGALVYNPGTPGSDGEIYYYGSMRQTAESITPSAPSGVVWNMSS